MPKHFLSYWQSLNFRAGYEVITKNGSVPLYDLRKYEVKIRVIFHVRKWGVVKKISIRCKALDVSPLAHVFSLIQ